jgi:hypothetical protein
MGSIIQRASFVGVVSLTAALSACGDDCEDAASRIAAKFEECGVSANGGDSESEEVECTEDLATRAQCDAGCIEAASCDDIKLTDPTASTTAKYLACRTDCASAE